MKKTTLLFAMILGNLQIIHAQAGELDPSFGDHGIVRSSISSGHYVQMAIQEHGKILLADNGLIRYNQDGSRDQLFKGITKTGNGIGAIAIQKDGKIVVATRGTFDQTIVLSRYTKDGILDSTKFDQNPLIFLGFVQDIHLLIQEDNKIILASGDGIFRYNSDGTIDIGFKKLNLSITSIAIQDDGKVIAAGLPGPDESNSYFTNFAVGRYNTDGTVDTAFSKNGIVFIQPEHGEIASSVAIQSDGKIVVGGYDYYYNGSTLEEFLLKRFNSNGTIDSSFSNDGTEITHFGSNEEICYAVAIQSDGKILAAGSALNNDVLQFAIARYSSDGSLDNTFSNDGKQITGIGEEGYSISNIAVYDNKLYAAGRDAPGNSSSILARYQLGDSIVATVKILDPSDFATFTGPANIKINVEAKPLVNRTISKVEFFNGNTLLHVEFAAPYGFTWTNVPLGTFTITAKATDNKGEVTASRPVKIYVVNKPPVISIIKPSQKQTVAAPGYIHLEADAKDSDGRITRVEFYNGSTLLRTEYKNPYTYVWKDVPRGTYTITAVATDNWGAQATSAPVTVRVTSASAIVSSRASSETEKTALNDALSLRLSPNPAGNFVNIYTSGLQQNKPATLSIISVSGIVLKTIQISKASTQLDISSLASGVYIIKIISGEMVLYKQFVKL